ncbi:MAG: aspartate aminotransferase family protein [Deltaproteobacteria bacterium]|nr:aspartate aminotransferase family protein [Deltaproteobacteria bacterium]
MSIPEFPKAGLSRDEVVARLKEAAAGDADWHGGHTFSLVYFAEDELLSVLKEAYTLFFSANALSPFAFPSLRRFEEEVVQMATSLLQGGPEAVGTMTSGGTESIMMAVKAARDRARQLRPEIEKPELLLPLSAHPAFEKAAHYFGLETVHVPLREDYRADPEEAERLITENTILMVGSAPGYPHGVVDPIEALAALAAQRDIPFHVDACLGGYLLPFLRRLGRPIPPFDFAVPGVTSISADLHKYGFAARGASTILYRSEDYRKHQFFAYTRWPGGLYGSPSMVGSRGGGAIAAAWAALTYLGEEGYLSLARTILETTEALEAGIEAIPGLRIVGEPDASVFAFTGDDLDIYAVGDAMEARGWSLDAQQLPAALHLMVTPAHAPVVEPFLADLREVAEGVRAGELSSASGMSQIYGMTGGTLDQGPVKDMILQLMSELLPPRRVA